MYDINNFPGSDSPLSIDVLNDILKESGLLPPVDDEVQNNVVNSSSTVEVIKAREDIIDKDAPVSQSVLNMFLSQELMNEAKEELVVATTDNETNSSLSFKEFLEQYNVSELMEILNKAEIAEASGVPFDTFFETLKA